MASKHTTSVALLFFSLLFLLSTTLVLSKTDPQLEHCKEQCHVQEHDRAQRIECEQRCREQHSVQWESWMDRCNKRCRHHREPHDQDREATQCEMICEERFQSIERCYQQACLNQHSEKAIVSCWRQCESSSIGYYDNHRQVEEERENPYYWGREGFRSRIKTQEGHIRVLERFNKRSHLLTGVENYRLALLEANPSTFVIPSHRDAEGIFFVMKGRGTITYVQEDKQESHDMQEGDIVRVPAGITTYMINRDKREKLQIAKLLHPISTPGQFKEYFAAGGENPETVYRSFSTEILEAAFNTPKAMVEKVLGQQRRGAIVRASPRQIRALSGGSRGAHWPFPEARWKPYNLFNEKRPSYSSKWGQLYEAGPTDFPQLQDLDVAVSLANITKGAMLAPLYNSEATTISLVVEGRGYFEMACPHLSSHHRETEDADDTEEQTQQRYEKVRSRLSPGDVIVAPAGHPIVTVASRDENLMILCFEINAKNNIKFYLTGKNNILKQLEREAKELSFGLPAREVDQLLDAQKQSVFLPGPEQQQQQQEKEERDDDGHGGLETILSFVAF